MFTIDDFWKIMKYLKDGETSPGLSELTTTLATSEKITVIELFERVLDQNTFTSDDYRRLREMIIDWYTTHKTVATTQKFASDVHQLPNNHLSELFKSFGFPLGLDLVPLTSKANFFLDLVNFYKKKGTPETLVDVLDYYGFSDSDLVEYWLLKDQYGNLVFRGESVRQAATGSTLLIDTDVTFEKMTNPDPHWFQTKEQIEALLLTNNINLPSKTPYFSLSSIFSLFTINASMSILFRIVNDQYKRNVIEGLELPDNILVKNVGEVVPLLHVYLATIYTFERMFKKEEKNKYDITTYLKHGEYKGEIEYVYEPFPIPVKLSEIVDEYEDLIQQPLTKDEREAKLVEYENNWSGDMPDNFLSVANTAEPLLESLNPSFKSIIDTWFDIGDESYLITYLIGTLDNWVRLNIDSKSPSLVITMLGLGFRDELDSIINFFKPYRARLAFMDTSFAIKNPLTESFLMDDWLLTQIESTYRDAIRPPTFPLDFCRDGTLVQPPAPDPMPPGYAGFYSKFRWDMGGVFDELPMDQMDEDYIARLKQWYLDSHQGTICDKIITSIDTFIHDNVGARIAYKNYDTGELYDTEPLEWWQDSFNMEISQAPPKDKILVAEGTDVIVKNDIIDSFGLEHANQFDVGHSFDGLHTRAPVRDDFHICISSLGFIEIKSTSSANITLGKIESLSSSVSAISSIFNTTLTGGKIELLSTTVSIRSISISTKPMLSYNNYFDRGKFFDIGPVSEP